MFAAHMSCDSSSYWSISAALDRPLQQTHRPPLLLSLDGTDGRTDCFMMLTAYCAEHVIMALIARDSW